MSNCRSLICLFLITSFAAGCDESSSTPSSPSSISASQLAGDWTVVSIQPTGQLAQVTPAGSIYTLTVADGRLSTRLDCNTCGGAFALSGQTLTAGPVLACTRAACPTMAFGDAYVSLLSGESTIALTGGNLVLSSARGVLRLVR
jgi:heat shock protein HslJ